MEYFIHPVYDIRSSLLFILLLRREVRIKPLMKETRRVWKPPVLSFMNFVGVCQVKHLKKVFTAMLFVVGSGFLLYSGIVFLADGLTGYSLLPDHKLLHALILLSGGLVSATIRNHSMRKNGAFERMKKRGRGRTRKVFAGNTLTVIYFIYACICSIANVLVV